MKIRTGSEFVDIIDKYLKEKELSRRQFCVLIDIPNSTIASWKSKNAMPSVELVAKVAQFMNVSLDWLVFGEQFEEADKDNVTENLYSRINIINRIGIQIRYLYPAESSHDLKILHKKYLSDIVDYEVLENWMYGKANMPDRVLPEIAKELKVSLQWLLTQEGHENEPDGYLFSLAKHFSKFLKDLNFIDEEKRKAICNLLETEAENKRFKIENKLIQDK